jgi:hypothetical protein
VEAAAQQTRLDQAGMGKTYRLLLAPALLTFFTGVAVFLTATLLAG